METKPASPDAHLEISPEGIGGGTESQPKLQNQVEDRIWGLLRECYDPEIPLNIVDLGLVYGVAVKGNQANVQMTLTSPGCHLGGQIAGNVQEKLLSLAEIEEANVELVWDPPWHQSMISAQGRKVLGLEPG
jgi:metal-sulfur cluster biosynthetic enzyme